MASFAPEIGQDKSDRLMVFKNDWPTNMKVSSKRVAEAKVRSVPFSSRTPCSGRQSL